MQDRKARIAALRAKAGRAPPPSSEDTAPATDTNPMLQVVSLVNSTPSARANKELKGGDETKESVLDRALRLAQQEASSTNLASGQLEDLAPKKINADLKREIQPKLDKLEKRTQKAIVTLLRERLEQEAAAEIDE